jgi:hypothetical protein
MHLRREDKERLEQILESTHYISSEESEEEGDSKVLMKRQKLWRSSWLDERFSMLDKKSLERNKGKGATYIKRTTGTPSERSAPEDAPEWAVIEDD